jgi:hypothetical protein
LENSNEERWPEMDKQFFDVSCIPHYRKDFFAKQFVDLASSKYP